MSSPLATEVERLADRLRVVGPRLAARGTPAAEAALAGIRDALQQLADVGADGQGQARRPVPVLAARALADQVLVLGREALAHGRPSARDDAAALLARLRRGL